MSGYIPLNRGEMAVMMLAVLCFGIALGAILVGMPHMTFRGTVLISISTAMGFIAFVALSIYRSNKEWKIRTEQLASKSPL